MQIQQLHLICVTASGFHQNLPMCFIPVLLSLKHLLGDGDKGPLGNLSLDIGYCDRARERSGSNSVHLEVIPGSEASSPGYVIWTSSELYIFL